MLSKANKSLRKSFVFFLFALSTFAIRGNAHMWKCDRNVMKSGTFISVRNHIACNSRLSSAFLLPPIKIKRPVNMF